MSPVLPLPSYALHNTPHPSTVNDTPHDSAAICGTYGALVPVMAGNRGRWGAVEGIYRAETICPPAWAAEGPWRDPAASGGAAAARYAAQYAADSPG